MIRCQANLFESARPLLPLKGQLKALVCMGALSATITVKEHM